jgi:uncharacterized membrane protein YidH (DUF202 family)
MEEISQAFQLLGALIEYFSIVTALAGAAIAAKGYRLAGAMIAIGSGLHAMGYIALTQLHHALDRPSPTQTLLISCMYPGLLMLTAGICYLAFTLGRKRTDA